MEDERERTVLLSGFLLAALAIVYGSLFPFQFTSGIDAQAVDVFLSSWRKPPGRGDILGNIVLFLPLGVLACLLFSARPGFAGLWRLLFFGGAIAIACQLAQIFIVNRHPSIFDLYCNLSGMILGWLIGLFLPREVFRVRAESVSPSIVPLLLALLWIAAQLIPFVPTIDLQVYKESLKPLLLAPQFSISLFLLEMVCWLSFFHLLNLAFERPVSKVLLAVVCMGVLLLRVPIVENSVSLGDALAGLSALVLWFSPLAARVTGALLGGALLVTYSLTALSPPEFRPEMASFGWLPLSGFLQGSMLLNAIALCLKLFVFGCLLVFLIPRPNLRNRALWLIAAWLFLLELIQLGVASGTPESTDPLLFLLLAWGYGYSSSIPDNKQLTAPDVIPEQEAAEHHSSKQWALDHLIRFVGVGSSSASPVVLAGSQSTQNRKATLFAVAGFWLIIVVSLKVSLSFAFLSGGVAEQLRFGGSGIDVLCLSLAIVSLGWGAGWLAGLYVRSSRPYLEIPVALIVVCGAFSALLMLSLSPEALNALTGDGFLVDRLLGGQVASETVPPITETAEFGGAALLVDLVESMARVVALVGPLFVFGGWCLYFALVCEGGKQYIRKTVTERRFVYLVLTLLSVIFVCKLVAFDAPPSGSLDQLIASDGGWGLGGGGYIYLLLLAECALAALVARGWFYRGRSLAIALAVVLVSTPLTWLLLSHGLEKNIARHGLYFSGVEILLSGAKGVPGTWELFFRWLVLHVVAVVTLAFGAALYGYWRGVGRVAKRGRSSASAMKLNLYEGQKEYLQMLARELNTSLDNVVFSIVRFFGELRVESPENAESLEAYIAKRNTDKRVKFAKKKIPIDAEKGELEELRSFNVGLQYSDSRVFRKLLQVFMTMAEDA